VINQLAGIGFDSPLGQLRAQRPEIVRYAQGSYDALLEPEDLAGVSRYERELIGLRVAYLTNTPALTVWHRDRLRSLGASDTELAQIEDFPQQSGLSARQIAILEHTDRLTRTPLLATPEHIAELKAAGLSARDIVTISQLIAFLSFQLRTLVGLRVLAEEV
jgi:CMD domain protein